MLPGFNPIREIPSARPFKKNDVLVLFGELFNRGYANGLVEEAEKFGMTIVRATVGRRDEENNLRSLTPEEIEKIPQPFINVPLEAGFDLEKDDYGQSPVDALKGVKLSEWKSLNVNTQVISAARAKAKKRFRQHVEIFTSELAALIDENIHQGCHVHFAHLMAGGVPRTKIVMPLMNRVFKGTEDRYLSSKEFLDSGMGEFIKENFLEVTADTFDTLVEVTTGFRERVVNSRGSVSYVAYGYHGTEVVIQDEYKWQSYAPYIQGWAKIQLEDYAKKWSRLGVRCCVYNCPEILTNSSSIFKGVEIPLYNLIRAFIKEGPTHALTVRLKADCERVLRDEQALTQMFQLIDHFLVYSEKAGTSQYAGWPQHSQKEQLASTLELSDEVIKLHREENTLMTAVLSEIIFKSCGYIMLHDGFEPQFPVAWIGHDMVAKCALAKD